jgi:hypothetical protein
MKTDPHDRSPVLDSFTVGLRKTLDLAEQLAFIIPTALAALSRLRGKAGQ